MDKNLEPSVNIVQLYGEYSPLILLILILMIFNFKGSEDLAIRNGHEGPYGGPPYDVYVFHKTKNKFVSSEDLSALTYENLDMFEVDSKRKRMITC